MTLGEKLRQARLDAGLSQRELCGGEITRNMLSLIENGSAKPSVQTLEFLAHRLGKPVSWFLDQEAVTSGNVNIVLPARQAVLAGEYEKALDLLRAYTPNDPIFDPEAALLQAKCCLETAKNAPVPQQKVFLEDARQAAQRSDCAKELLLQIALMEGWLQRDDSAALARCMEQVISALEPEIRLLIGRFLLQQDAPEAAEAVLEPPVPEAFRWEALELRGDALAAQNRWQEALGCFREGEKIAAPSELARFFRKIEQCALAVDDYKTAYEYAKKQQAK